MLAIADAQLPAAFRRLHREAGFQYLFPLAVKGSARGFLLCGARRDGAPLGGEDLDTLAALAAQAAGGIEATRLRREIEERNHREKRLRREADAILQSARMGILLTDATGVITAANSAAEELVECADLLGLAIERVLPEDLLERLNGANQAGCAEERQGKGASVLRYVLERHGGEGRVVNARRSFLEGNELSGSVYALDDISEEVRREEKMVRQDHLAAVGLLASQVAHEVNTPLSGIASYAQILMDRMKSRVPEMELLKKIEAQAFRAAGIAGSVLNFTRRKEEAPAEEFDPGPVIAESLALFEPNLKGKRIRFSMERAPSLPAIRGHRGQVQQVVLNLLLNAAQALPAGGEIRLCLDRDGEAIRIRVSDTGVGIPARHLSRIFEPFYSVRTDGSGTGLGLSVVQKIVKEHGGSIQVESVEGSGSTFTVFLPACPVREKELAHGA